MLGLRGCQNGLVRRVQSVKVSPCVQLHNHNVAQYGIRHPASALRFNARQSSAASSIAAGPTKDTGKTVPLPELAPIDDDFEIAHTLSRYANWLIPGRLMVGRYPYVEPSRCTRREQGELQLQQILKAGVTTFVSLQAELPPQENIRAAGIHGFLPYKPVADLIHASMHGPPPLESLNALRNPYLDKFLPAARKQKSESQMLPADLEYCHFPIVDLGLPTPELLLTVLANLKQRLMAGEVIYMHCWGGRGRVGTVGACFLIQNYGLSAEAALTHVQRAFDTRLDSCKTRSPETDAQFDFVRAFAATKHTD